MAAVLEDVLTAIGRARRPVVVFDVDSTLVSTSGRHLAILRAFAAERGDRVLEAAAAALGPTDFGWTVDEPVRHLLTPDTAEALQAYWWEAFFSGRFLHHDTPTPGAVGFVHAARDAGAWVYYLTARTADRMGPETMTSLHAMGFPLLDGRVTLHLKHPPDLADHAFKRDALASACWLGDVVATFENEPANANHFREALPDGVHVLLDTVCTPNAPAPHPDVRSLRDFRG